jgi:hypothetical protein
MEPVLELDIPQACRVIGERASRQHKRWVW